jgi:hypothetical protein
MNVATLRDFEDQELLSGFLQNNSRSKPVQEKLWHRVIVLLLDCLFFGHRHRHQHCRIDFSV